MNLFGSDETNQVKFPTAHNSISTTAVSKAVSEVGHLHCMPIAYKMTSKVFIPKTHFSYANINESIIEIKHETFEQNLFKKLLNCSPKKFEIRFKTAYSKHFKKLTDF